MKYTTIVHKGFTLEIFQDFCEGVQAIVGWVWKEAITITSGARALLLIKSTSLASSILKIFNMLLIRPRILLMVMLVQLLAIRFILKENNVSAGPDHTKDVHKKSVFA